MQRLVTFYVREYNEVMPHGALDWRTPNEVYFGRAEDVPIKLDVARRAAREARLTANRATGARLRRLSSKKLPESESEGGKHGKVQRNELSRRKVQKVLTLSTACLTRDPRMPANAHFIAGSAKARSIPVCLPRDDFPFLLCIAATS